jgi:hypothetical protein
MTDVLNSQPMAQLCAIVEEAARSSKEGVKYFVEPAGGSLRRAKTRRHHILFGRRGSGKSSLLLKVRADLTVDRRPIAVVDLEPFKGHSYPDLLLSVLIATFRSFKTWLEEAAIAPATKTSFWQRWFGQVPTKPAFDKKQCAKLVEQLTTQIADLEVQLHAADAAQIQTKQSTSASAELTSGDEIGAKIGPVSLSDKEASKDVRGVSAETQEEYKRSKVDFLRRHIMTYQGLFDELARVSGGASYLILDDLYHIRKEDQASVVDYVHSVAKGHDLWLKIGTIRHRSRWYVHGDPPRGVKLGDDAEEIDLDLTLEKYALAKDFLVKILENLSQTVGLTVKQVLTDGAVERLVLASGGVARDFLSIFRKSVDVAREKKVAKITAEEINVAAGEHDSTKREELSRDTYTEEEESLYNVFNDIRQFCLDAATCNCFLLDKDTKGRKVEAIHELVDLKLLHLVRSRVTVSKRQGHIFDAYMLDLSQYAGSRARRGLQIVEFWKPNSDEMLRKVSLIFNPAQQQPLLPFGKGKTEPGTT